MNHLEEGTIHAWLDGALDPAQSAEVDAHVKACAECSAKVAEARGLIAASSRILTALDDTPANVIPKKALASAAPRRRLSTASWVSGLAAAAILVVLWRTGDVERPTPASQISIPPIEVVSRLPEPSLEGLKQPAPPPPAITTPVGTERRQSRVANTPQATIGRVAGAGAGGAAADLASAQVAAAPAAPPAPTETRATALREEAQRREVSASTALRRATTDAVDTVRFLSLKDEAVAIAGCYRIPDPPQLKLAEVVVTSGAAEARAPEKAARARGAVASVAPAPAATQKTAAADGSSGVLVRFDSLGVVRAIGSDSVVGSWAHFRADSARARVGVRSTIVSSLDKVRCP
jgi:hypothetical protein